MTAGSARQTVPGNVPASRDPATGALTAKRLFPADAALAPLPQRRRHHQHGRQHAEGGAQRRVSLPPAALHAISSHAPSRVTPAASTTAARDRSTRMDA